MLPVLAISVFCIVTWTAALNDPSPDLPRFGKPLNNLTISVGREAIFTCIVENLGLYKVAWLRVDTQTILTIGTHVITKNHRIAVTHSGHRTWSLHIKDTKVTDKGWYMCQVNTDPMSSNTGFLEVVALYLPSSLIASESSQPPKFPTHREVAAKNHGRFWYRPEHVIWQHRVQTGHQSDQATAYVPPDILDYPTSTDMAVQEGSNVTLRCAATGTPEPTVTWRREAGGTITLSNLHEVPSFQGPELEITRVTRLHMGPYLCIASNGVPPTVSKRIVLIVHFQPMVWIENQLVGAYEGQTLTLECRSEAFPRPITYWTRPSNETVANDINYKVEAIPSGYEITMRLTIKSVRPEDFGFFRCVATNSLGETDGKIKIDKIDRPPTTRRPSTRRDSKKAWKIDHSHERKTAGMKDEPMLKGLDGDDEQIDFQSATASSPFHRHLFANLGITAITAILAGLST